MLKLATAVSVALGVSSVVAQSGVPLFKKRFDYNNLPYKADTDDGERGIQFGYNKCNSTTENQNSLCQTAMVNSIDDFCLWGAPKPDSVVGDTEGESVAWCTKPGRGTRLIPAGALTGVQFMRTPDYVQVTGHINQALINIKAGDSGGELDPHGADQRGNPLGGLLFSNAFPSNGGKKDSFQQVIEWHNFMGGDVFCIKACDPAGKNAADFCEHIYDRIGCAYNAPAAYVDGIFESCEGANQDFPGIYTDAAGVVQTYRQPPEALGPIQTLPYDPKIPASSNCQAFQSTAIYAALPTPSVASSAAPSSSPIASSGASAPASPSNSGAASSKPSGSAPSSSPSGNAAPGLQASTTSAMFWSGLVVVVGGLIGGVATI